MIPDGPVPSVDRSTRVVMSHLVELYSFYGIEQGVRIARKHVQWYAEKLGADPTFRTQFNRALTPDLQQNLVNTLFAQLFEKTR